MMESYVTVATDDITCLGCLVLCNSLKQTGTEKNISVLVYPDVSQHLRSVLQKSFDHALDVKDLNYPFSNSNMPNEFEKLKCWLLTQFSKCVFLESDVLVIENIDDLFERQEFSAVADSRWPDSFDAGVFVYVPNNETYAELIEFSIKNSVKDSVQGLLNLFFCNWNSVSIENKIPFLYNCQLNSTFYTHTNALLHFGRSIKAAKLGNSVHEMMQPSMLQDSNYANWNRLWLLWWKIFNEMVKPSLTVKENQDFNRTVWSSDKFQSNEISSSENNDYTTIQSQASTTTVEEYKDVHQIVNATVCSNETSSGSYHNMPNDVQSYCSINEFCSNNDKTDAKMILVNLENTAQKSVQLETQLDDNSIVTENVEGKSSESEFLEELENSRRQKWERGEIDYMGKDSFQNILTQLNAKINNQHADSNLHSEE